MTHLIDNVAFGTMTAGFSSRIAGIGEVRFTPKLQAHIKAHWSGDRNLTIAEQHSEKLGLATDDDLMKIIANSTQELRKRGYDVEMTPLCAASIPNEPVYHGVRVTLTRSVTSGEKHD